MLVNRRTVEIEWGHCDAAGIVFFPNYFKMFDHSTHLLFAVAGYPLHELPEKFQAIGVPMVDTRARFIISSKYGDKIDIESRVTEWRRSSFLVEHKVFKGEDLAIEAHDTRVWVGAHPDEPGKLKSRPIPAEVMDAFARFPG